MIRVENLSSRVGRFSLHSVSLKVEAGEYFVILGPSGSGKTMLLEHIAGIRRPAAGSIFVNGADVTAAPPEKRRIGYVPQDYVLFPFLNVEANIMFGVRDRGPGNKKRIDEIISVLRLKDLMDRDARTLSGGEKQRVALARALATGPHALLLDEPFSSLDAGLRYKLWIEMRRIHKELGVTVLHITHDMEEAYTLSDRMAVIMNGRVEQSGLKEDVFYFPRTRGVAEFFGMRNIFSGSTTEVLPADGDIVAQCGPHRIIAPAKKGVSVGDAVDICIRPQGIKVLKENKPLRKNLSENIFAGTVVASIPHGNTYTFYFKPDGSGGGEEDYFEIRIPSMAYKKMEIDEGRRISVSLKKNALWILDKS